MMESRRDGRNPTGTGELPSQQYGQARSSVVGLLGALSGTLAPPTRRGWERLVQPSGRPAERSASHKFTALLLLHALG